ncbi:MAG: TRAP transporter large permease subunit [Alphaproteobacteria bacterium]|nr:TRAP transporter large permease subunit [Alphaproteobacteria bacterium]MCB9928825.1 TRAP transporter large permease subunit [Alphaproteobacteria bacterium]
MILAEILSLLLFGGVCVALMAGFPVAFTLGGVSLIFGLIGYGVGAFDLSYLGFIPNRIYGTMTNEVLLAVPLFVFMGVMLERSKVADDLLNTMGGLFGSMRGGLGISVCVVGALLAASTGIVGATVVTMGLLSLPTMLRWGYDPKLACGTICASGTLGQIIPPSIVLVVLGDQISNAYQDAQRALGNFAPDPVSVGDLFAGALIPGLMLVGLYIGWQLLMAALRPESAPPAPPEIAQANTSLATTLSALVVPIILIIAVLGSILAGIATPTEAAAVGAIGATLLGGLRLTSGRQSLVMLVGGLALVGVLILTGALDLRLGRNEVSQTEQWGIYAAALCCVLLSVGILDALRRTHANGTLREVMQSTAKISAMVFGIVIGAQLFSLVFRGFGGDDIVHEFLNNLPGGAFGAMLVVMLVMFIMGFFLDFIEITFVVIPIVAPILLMMDLNPVWLGIMIAVNLQTSFLTPPFGFALFYLRGVAPPSVTTMQIYTGIIPFVGMQIVMLGILWMFPDLTLWLPRLVYGTVAGG